VRSIIMVDISAILLKKQEARRNNQLLKNEISRTRARLKKIEEDKLAAKLLQISIQKEKEEQEAIAAKIAFEEAELKRKTIKYFRLNKFNRKIADKECTTYFGDHEDINDAWIPHGEGKIIFGDEVQYQGNFNHGLLHGRAIYNFEDGSSWYCRPRSL